MNITRYYQFRPSLAPTLAMLIVFPLLLGLGFWQLDRAGEKAAIQADFAASYDKPAVLLNEVVQRWQTDNLLWRPVIVNGDYANHSYFLDNQVYRGKPGYRVYTPLRLAGSDKAVLIERDWLAMGATRKRLPAITTPVDRVNLEGRVVPSPATGIMLSEHRIEPVDDDYYRVQRIKPDELAAHSGLTLLPYIVRLDTARHAGDDRAAALQGFGRERHLGYAFQWFALAATLLVIYVWVNIERRKENHE